MVKKQNKKKENQCFCLKNKQTAALFEDWFWYSACQKLQSSGPCYKPFTSCISTGFQDQVFRRITLFSLSRYLQSVLMPCGGWAWQCFQVAQTYPLIFFGSPSISIAKGKNRGFTHFLISDLAKQFIITGGLCWGKQQLELKYLFKGKRKSLPPHCLWSRQLMLSQIPAMCWWVNSAAAKLFGLG